MPSVKRTFTLPDDVSMALDDTIPSKQRSKFLAATLREALRDEKRSKLLEFLDNAPKKSSDGNARSEDLFKKLRQDRAKELHENSTP